MRLRLRHPPACKILVGEVELASLPTPLFVPLLSRLQNQDCSHRIRKLAGQVDVEAVTGPGYIERNMRGIGQ